MCVGVLVCVYVWVVVCVHAWMCVHTDLVHCVVYLFIYVKKSKL